MKASRAPGFLAYVAIGLWFLLTILTPLSAKAEESHITLSPAEIEPSITAALESRGLQAIEKLIFENPAQKLFLEKGAELEFEAISVNPQSGRFVVRIASQSTPIIITGRARVERRLAVLAQDAPRGAIITEDDIKYTDRSDIRGGLFIEDASDLIGMETRRPIAASAPIRQSDVKLPLAVKRGAIVSVLVEKGGLRLSLQAVAAANGAVGDVVAFENPASRRVLKAVVTGPNRARVLAGAQ